MRQLPVLLAQSLSAFALPQVAPSLANLSETTQSCIELLVYAACQSLSSDSKVLCFKGSAFWGLKLPSKLQHICEGTTEGKVMKKLLNQGCKSRCPGVSMCRGRNAPTDTRRMLRTIVLCKSWEATARQEEKLAQPEGHMLNFSP